MHDAIHLTAQMVKTSPNIVFAILELHAVWMDATPSVHAQKNLTIALNQLKQDF